MSQFGNITTGGTATASASANTKGAYSTLGSGSTPFSADHCYLMFGAASAAAAFLVDLATGAAGAETVILPNLMFQQLESVPFATAISRLSIPIAASTRIAGRAQASTGSRSLGVGLQIGQSGRGLQSGAATSYGAVTGTSRGTLVDAGAVADTPGAYSQLTASCGEIKECLLMVGNNLNSADAQTYYGVQIATGAGGAETIVLAEPQFIRGTGAITLRSAWAGPFDLEVAAGTRIAARARGSITDATDRIGDVSLIGVTGTLASGGFRAARAVANELLGGVRGGAR